MEIQCVRGIRVQPKHVQLEVHLSEIYKTKADFQSIAVSELLSIYITRTDSSRPTLCCAFSGVNGASVEENDSILQVSITQYCIIKTYNIMYYIY